MGKGVNSVYVFIGSMCMAITLFEDGLLLVFVFRTQALVWRFVLRRASRASPFAWVSPRAPSRPRPNHESKLAMQAPSAHVRVLLDFFVVFPGVNHS